MSDSPEEFPLRREKDGSATDPARILLDVSDFRLSGKVDENGVRREMSLRIPRLRLRAGEITAIIGGSGCGKSVLLSLLMGYPSFGIGGALAVSSFSVFGVRMPASAFRFPEMAAAWRRKMLRSGGLFYLPQAFPLAKTRGGDTLSSMVQVVQAMAFPARISGRKANCLVTASFERHQMRDACLKKLGALSGGERRRAELLARLIAMETARRPSILVLDEPTTGFDPANAQQFIRDVRVMIDEIVAMGIPAAALVSTHEMKSLDDRLDGDGRRVIDRVCVVNRDLEGSGDGDCTIVFDGVPEDVFPAFFDGTEESSGRTFAVDGDALFERIRERKSGEWVERWLSEIGKAKGADDVS